MKRTLICLSVLLGVFLLLRGCHKTCYGSGEIIELLNRDQTEIDRFEWVKVDLDGRSRSLTTPEEISEFSQKFHDSFSNYMETHWTVRNRYSKRKRVGEITVKKRGQPESAYELHRSTELPDLYAFRIHDPSKGGGSIMYFRAFSVAGAPMF